jgi:hypothetical protein
VLAEAAVTLDAISSPGLGVVVDEASIAVSSLTVDVIASLLSVPASVSTESSVAIALETDGSTTLCASV